MNLDNQRPLGASHVLGGWLYKIASVLPFLPSPQNGQECSGSPAHQPSSLRCDRYAAMGLIPFWELLNLDPEVLTGFLGLLSVTFLGFIVYCLRLGCKNEASKTWDFACAHVESEEISMLARFDEYITEDFIGDNLETKVEVLRQKLEQIFSYECLRASAQEDINEFTQASQKFQGAHDLKSQIKQLNRVEEFAQRFSEKYKDQLKTEGLRLLQDLCHHLKRTRDLFSAIDSIEDGINGEKLNFKKMAESLDVLADLIDDDLFDITGALDGFVFLTSLALDVAKERTPKNKSEQKYWKQIKHTASYVIHRGEEVKLQNKQNTEKVSFKDMLELWEDKYDEDEMYEASIFIEQALKRDSSP